MTVINRYLLREVALPFFGVFTLLLVVFASYSAAAYLADAVEGLLDLKTVLLLVYMRCLIALEIILPIALFVAVLLGLGRLYSDGEMVVLQAVGISERQVLQAVGYLALLVALAVGLSANYLRPWAYSQSHWLRAQALLEVDLNQLQPGRFQASREGERVLFARQVSRAERRLDGVFIKSERDGVVQIITAEQAVQAPVEANQPPKLTFDRGRLYRLNVAAAPAGRSETPLGSAASADLVVSFNELALLLADREAERVGQSRKTAPTAQLLASDNPKDRAEVQWRLSRPLSALLLGLLAVPLSRADPRRSRYSQLGLAALACVVYYNAALLARSWVKRGVVESVPGVWWADGLLLLVIVLLVWQPWRFWPKRCRPAPVLVPVGGR